MQHVKAVLAVEALEARFFGLTWHHATFTLAGKLRCCTTSCSCLAHADSLCCCNAAAVYTLSWPATQQQTCVETCDIHVAGFCVPTHLAYAASACSYPCNALLQVFQRTLHLLERLTTEGAMPAYWDPCSTDQAVVAACFWIATKAEGNRNTVPSRTLLTRAIATVAPSVLINTEMQVLFALRWNVGATEELQG